MFFLATRARDLDLRPWSTVPPLLRIILFFPMIYLFLIQDSRFMNHDYVFSSLRRPLVMVFRTLPRTVREFVFVRWPRAGNFFAWRVPRYALVSLRRRLLPLLCRRSSPSSAYFSIASRKAPSSFAESSLGFLDASIPRPARVAAARGRPTP